MTRVLVTGSTGLLGTSLARVLEEYGFSVVRHGRQSGDVSGDLTDPGIVQRVVAGARADCVVNLAALTNVDACEERPNDAYLLNTRVVENIAAAAAVQAFHLVQISTDQIYDGTGPHDEDDVRLTNYYAYSKYAGELAAARVPSTILRTNFFGKSIHTQRRSFSDWIVTALKEGRPTNVFDDIQFSPLTIDSLTRLIALAVEKRIAGTFNVGSRNGMSKADFCFVIAAVLGLSTRNLSRTTSDSVKLKAYRPKDMRMRSNRFESAFGVSMPALQSEIEAVKRYYDAGS